MERQVFRRGFTLIELMLVVAIIGLLAAIAIPKFANLVTKAKEGAVKGKLGTIRSAAQLYYVDNPEVDSVFTFYVTSFHNFNYLVPKYLDEIPMIEHPTQPDHRRGNGVSTGLIDGLWVGSGWTYTWNSLGGPSALPRIFMNCSHTDSIGRTWSQY
ncbi:MAG TPA: prepilin-type N-terminal cleavage/methylation domain-containing protein [Elusimicrobiota bacterium]|jgi:prepilin-type N-terminal cleavage/methylation domain-containing protein|nr:prepilin-type N-terminal cleavage/methylation domain-containing protein [Elusimicrobiota bacterium]HNC74724.1 prepilin-type N-terminal cleavage/methylation domain-containing protein [Elusimicrobiota bacterium]HNG44467.1 prepilin-type N-terminal cleavage/methylation domain-containing protein [Elusimicrobiota bacterium]